MSEAHVDRRQLAALMGVSERTIDRLRAAGMPSATWGMRVRRYLPSECIAWARGREAARTMSEHVDGQNTVDERQSKE